MRIMKSVFIGGSFAKWSVNPPAANDIDIDNDGVISPAPGFEVDLSSIASFVLGRQVSMMSAVKLHRLSVGIRPVDDITDNDESAFFAGHIWWTPPTDHAKKALSLARAMEKAQESTVFDGDSFLLSDENDYTGYRYSYLTSGTTQYQTVSGIGGYDHTLIDLETAYDAMTAVPQNNALFNGRFPGECSVAWIAALASGVGASHSPPPGGNSADWTVQMNHLALPILRGEVSFSSGDEEGTVDDDYHLWVDVDFTVDVEVF